MVLVIQKHVIMEDKIIKLSDSEEASYVGGATITASIVSAITGLIKTIYGMGQEFGSSLKRAITKQRC